MSKDSSYVIVRNQPYEIVDFFAKVNSYYASIANCLIVSGVPYLQVLDDVPTKINNLLTSKIETRFLFHFDNRNTDKKSYINFFQITKSELAIIVSMIINGLSIYKTLMKDPDFKYTKLKEVYKTCVADNNTHSNLRTLVSFRFGYTNSTKLIPVESLQILINANLNPILNVLHLLNFLNVTEEEYFDNLVKYFVLRTNSDFTTASLLDPNTSVILNNIIPAKKDRKMIFETPEVLSETDFLSRMIKIAVNYIRYNQIEALLNQGYGERLVENSEYNSMSLHLFTTIGLLMS
jgi:hypothetical protein